MVYKNITFLDMVSFPVHFIVSYTCLNSGNRQNVAQSLVSTWKSRFYITMHIGFLQNIFLLPLKRSGTNLYRVLDIGWGRKGGCQGLLHSAVALPEEL